MSISFFIAKRLFSKGGTKKKKVSVPAIAIATAGIAIGLATMIVSICVVLGFQQEIREKVIGFGSHIEILNINTLSSTESYPVATSPELMQKTATMPNIGHVQRFATKTGILKTDEDFSSIQLKGVAQEYNLNFIRQNLVSGKLPQFSDDHNSNTIVISQLLADKLKLKTGDKVFAYFFEKTVKTRRFTVAAIYQTNMEQFDKSIIFTDLKTVQQLNAWLPEQTSGLEIAVKDYGQLYSTSDRMAMQLKNKTDRYGATYCNRTIEELYPQIFDWLGLLDLNVWIILGLMVCVGGFTMISGLLILILENTNTIGLLKALGATNRKVRHIFLYFSVFIILRGLLIGNLIGLGIVWAQWQWGIVKLDPTTYYVNSVPVFLNPWLILILNVGTLLVTVLALIGPSFLISRIQPAKAIRYE